MSYEVQHAMQCVLPVNASLVHMLQLKLSVTLIHRDCQISILHFQMTPHLFGHKGAWGRVPAGKRIWSSLFVCRAIASAPCRPSYLRACLCFGVP